MAQVYSPATAQTQPLLPTARRESVAGVIVTLFLAVCAGLSIYQQRPPQAVGAGAPPAEFSSGRAMRQLEVITRKPHPMGSVEHERVRDYLLGELAAAGVEPEVQRATAADPQWSGPVRAGSVQNIVARLKGTDNTKAVLLVGHYDSTPTSLGASDDGVAVVTLLETLRALKAGAPLKNDVIFLFTDGEEAFLLGSKAFVDEHPWAKDVGLVLNFEARGSSGPAIMFETSDNNGRLIEEFARVAPHPVSHSLAYEIYRILPNDTDLSVFKRAGLPGLNFAYIDDLPHYHTLLDSFDRTDERSLQHQGSYALSLARGFGNLDLRNIKAPNAVYFDILGLALVRYSSLFVVPLSIGVTILFAGVLALGLRRRRLTPRGIAFGFLAFLLNMIAAAGIVTLLWKLMNLLAGGGIWKPEGETYRGHLYLAGFAALTVAITSALYTLFRRKSSTENLAAGALLWWLMLLIAASLFLPGASYLFTWPLLFSLIGFGAMLLGEGGGPVKPSTLVLMLVCSVPGVVMLVPLIYQTFTGLTVSLSGPLMVVLLLLLGLLLPHMNVCGGVRKWLLPGVAALAGWGFVLAATLTSGYSPEQPKMNDIFYGLHAETGKAVWVSAELDQWTAQFHAKNPEKGTIPEFLTATSGRPWKTQAPVLPLPAPDITLLDDSGNSGDGLRTLRMRIKSPRGAEVMTVYIDSEVEVVKASVNNRLIDESVASPSLGRKKQWSLRYYAVPPEGIELTTEMRTTAPVRVRAVDLSYGLPEIPGANFQPRPAHMIPALASVTDTTLVSKSFTF
ncbi:MAG: M28 family metallopeptidase [Acidobacteria bacterium]|nr:M28 family metallopeptidase [Acidobacteriota bacterium]